MAAYAAVTSLMNIIHLIENHPSPPISLDKQQVESLTEIVTFLQEFLEGYSSPFADSNKADPLEMRIADAAYEAEDVIESNIVDRIQSPRNRIWFFNCFRSLKKTKNNGLKKVIEAMDLIKRDVMDNDAEEEVVQDQLQRQVSSASASLTRLNSTMVGFDDVRLEIMDKLTSEERYRQVIPIVGMGGIGKTTLAKNIYAHKLIKERFDICAWTTISQKYNTKEILRELLSQVNKKWSKDELGEAKEILRELLSRVNKEGSEDELGEAKEILRELLSRVNKEGSEDKLGEAKEILRELLSQVNKEGSEDELGEAKEILLKLLSQVAKEILLKLLSQWSEDELGEALHKYLYGRRFLIVLDDMWDIEAWEKMQHYFPDNGNSSRILVTTRLSNLSSQLANNYRLEMKFLDGVSSWGIFSEIVFKGKSCPLELEDIGKKIVESCRGLPLSIVVIGGLLEKLERTKNCWESIRRNLNSLVNSENDEHCLKILKMSYNHLPVHLKSCFLYMGVFEEDSAIRVSTVIKLWVSEGFLKPISEESLETTAKGYIKELVDRNLILVHKLGSTGNVKFCKMHDLLRDLCLRESQKERLYHHIIGQQSSRSTGSECSIVIPRGSLKKKVLNAIKSTPYACSCISLGTERVRLFPNLKLLRTLDDERHKYSTNEYVNLPHLVVEAHPSAKRPSIHLLWCLHRLIIVSHHGVEIWKMPQLRHVQFSEQGFHLPNPPRDNIVIMENLQTLTGVVNFKCVKEVVRRIPNIKKLGLIYDEDKGTGFNHLHNIKCLRKLESLNCQYHVEDDYNLKRLSFPHSLTKLNLSVIYRDMEDMLAKIGSLPLLQKLSLDGGRFRTGTWEVVEGQFPSLKFLSLKWFENLEIWTMESSPFPYLEQLHLQYVPKLKEIPTEIGEIPTLKSIVLDSCSASAVKSMKKIVKEQQELQGDDLPFKVQVFLHFWENEELQNLANPNFQVTTISSDYDYEKYSFLSRLTQIHLAFD